jgi:hypothetical protein
MKLSWRSTRALLAAGAMTTALGAGCASAPLHTDASTAGIRAAEEVGAPEVPRAALHLQLAKEELEQAQVLASRGKKGQAGSMLQRSEADAELAVALSREAGEGAEARAALERARQLRQDGQTP